MKRIKLWGYTIDSNGNIFGKRGKQITPNKEIKIRWGNKGICKYVSYARFVYYAFNKDKFDFDDKSITIRQKNENKDDFSIENLIAVERKTYNQGENNSCAKLTDKQVEEIKDIYNQFKDDRIVINDPNAKISYRKLAEQYGVSHTMIMGIVKGQFRNKENYKS